MTEHEFKELKQEVRRFLAEGEETRTPTPFLRIGEIILAMRKYKAEVIAANSPCGFLKGSESDPTKRESLRQHRLQYLNDNEGLKPQKEWLMALDTEFVLQGALYRVQDTQWQFKVWSPLFGWAQQGFAIMFDRSGVQEWPKYIGLADLHVWEEKELEIECELFLRMQDFLPEGEWPIVDLHDEQLHWAGRTGKLTPRELRFLKCLIEKKGAFVDVEDICDAVDTKKAIGTKKLDSRAFRQMVKRLKDNLKSVGFDDIEDAIEKSNVGSYRLDHEKLLDLLAKRESSIG